MYIPNRVLSEKHDHLGPCHDIIPAGNQVPLQQLWQNAKENLKKIQSLS